MSDADYLTEAIPDSIAYQDDDVIEDLDFSPSLTRPSKSYVEGTLDKLQNISLYISYVDDIWYLTLKVETFLNKEWTGSIKQGCLTDLFFK